MNALDKKLSLAFFQVYNSKLKIRLSLCLNSKMNMTFEELNLNKALWSALDELGYKIPTPIQERVFSVAMSGRDVIGIAQTGTGKTFGYLLPLLRLWKFSKEPHPQILILVPTRELVVQVVEAIEQLTPYMNVVAGGVYGGTNIKTQMALCIKGLDIVVGTPGRLRDLVMKGALKLKSVNKVVIDEVDEMLNLGFRPQLERIFDLLSDKRQNLLFSATMTPEVDALMETYFNFPERVEAAPSGTPLENINQVAYNLVNFNTKANFLKLILADKEKYQKVLLFIGTKKLADLLAERIEEDFPEEIAVIHSNKTQNTRFLALENFRSGQQRILIATDLVARGLDIHEVSHVINFDIPDVPENYMHRIGRTGRADRKGEALALVGKLEEKYFDEIQSLMKFKLPVDDNPEELVIIEELIEAEKPVVFMKNLQPKLPKVEEGGGAFHEKKLKNQKVNNKLRRADKMKLKYGKPQTRGMKVKGKKKKRR